MRSAIWACSLVILVASAARAQVPDEPECPSVEDGRLALGHEGRAGIWLALPLADCVERRLRWGRLLLGHARLLEQRIELEREHATQLRHLLELAEHGERLALDRAGGGSGVDWWPLGIGLVVGLLGAGLVALAATVGV